jgi:hypothetical protein
VTVEALGELVVVFGGRARRRGDVEVDVVEHRVAEGVGNAGAGATKVGVPEVVGEVHGGLRGRVGVVGVGGGG